MVLRMLYDDSGALHGEIVVKMATSDQYWRCAVPHDPPTFDKTIRVAALLSEAEKDYRFIEIMVVLAKHKGLPQPHTLPDVVAMWKFLREEYAEVMASPEGRKNFAAVVPDLDGYISQVSEIMENYPEYRYPE